MRYFCYLLWMDRKAVLAAVFTLVTDYVDLFLLTKDLMQLQLHVLVNDPFFCHLYQHQLLSFFIAA